MVYRFLFGLQLNLWCKINVFEAGTRVPFMIQQPSSSSPAVYSNAIVEAVDLMPTLVEVAAGSAAPPYCDGTSLAPILANPKSTVKEGAFSEFVKCYSCCRVPDVQNCLPGGTQGRCAPTNPAGLDDLHEMGDCFQVPREQIDYIGYSVRTHSWRYTEWLRFNGTILHGDFAAKVGSELYSHIGDNGTAHSWDEFENVNVVDEPAYAAII